jgi:hypothetical protein
VEQAQPNRIKELEFRVLIKKQKGRFLLRTMRTKPTDRMKNQQRKAKLPKDRKKILLITS